MLPGSRSESRDTEAGRRRGHSHRELPRLRRGAGGGQREQDPSRPPERGELRPFSTASIPHWLKAAPGDPSSLEFQISCSWNVREGPGAEEERCWNASQVALSRGELSTTGRLQSEVVRGAGGRSFWGRPLSSGGTGQGHSARWRLPSGSWRGRGQRQPQEEGRRQSCLNPKPLEGQIPPSPALIISPRPSSSQGLVIASAAAAVGGQARADEISGAAAVGPAA